MAANVSNALVDQFTRTWDMILDAAARFHGAEFYEATVDRMQPARIVYHLLFATERYTYLGTAEEFSAKRQFALDWMKLTTTELPQYETALQQLQHAKDATLEWVRRMGENSLITENSMWSWTGETAIGQAMYHLRHLQHHMAELNVELRRRGLKTVEWK